MSQLRIRKVRKLSQSHTARKKPAELIFALSLGYFNSGLSKPWPVGQVPSATYFCESLYWNKHAHSLPRCQEPLTPYNKGVESLQQRMSGLKSQK